MIHASNLRKVYKTGDIETIALDDVSFDIKKGDILVLEEWDPKLKKYTGRKIEKKLNYVLMFNLDDFGQKKEIEEKGLYIIQF